MLVPDVSGDVLLEHDHVAHVTALVQRTQVLLVHSVLVIDVIKDVLLKRDKIPNLHSRLRRFSIPFFVATLWNFSYLTYLTIMPACR